MDNILVANTGKQKFHVSGWSTNFQIILSGRLVISSTERLMWYYYYEIWTKMVMRSRSSTSLTSDLEINLIHNKRLKKCIILLPNKPCTMQKSDVVWQEHNSWPLTHCYESNETNCWNLSQIWDEIILILHRVNLLSIRKQDLVLH